MIPSRVFFVTAPDIATVNRIQRLVPTLVQGTATSVVVRANKSTVRSVLGILRPWPRFRTLGICFPTRLAIGSAAVCGTFLSLMLQRRFCNSVDLCLRAQCTMKEALLFNECFVESIVKREAASSAPSLSNSTTRVQRVSSANCNTPVVGRILLPGMFAVAKSVRVSTKYETTRAPHRFAIC